MRIYLSGPITGLEETEIAQNFYNARIEVLRLFPSAEIINPYVICKGMPFNEWKDFMQICLKILGECDMIYMMPGWHHSMGCHTEYFFAIGCKMRIIKYNDPEFLK